MPKVAILLGSNIGNRLDNLHTASENIRNRYGSFLKKSSIYETEPWGSSSNQWYLNQVIIIVTNDGAKDLLNNLLQIESKMGRRRTELKNEDRIIDIDILFYGQFVYQFPDLIIPHPLLHERRFTLLPLVEIIPTYCHPVIQKTMQQLLEECKDKQQVRVFEI